MPTARYGEARSQACIAATLGAVQASKPFPVKSVEPAGSVARAAPIRAGVLARPPGGGAAVCAARTGTRRDALARMRLTRARSVE